MYPQIAGAGTAAGVPALLAYTGVTGPGVAMLLAVASLSLVAGVSMLRWVYRGR